MKQKDNGGKVKAGEPVIEFISGKTSSMAAKRLTKSIGSVQSLWQLAKMAEIVKKYSEENNDL